MQPDWSYTFAAAKGPKGLTILARPYFDRVVSTLAEGEECVLTLSAKVEKRTNAQNRMLWGTTYDQLLMGIGHAEGLSVHDLKPNAKAKDYLHEGLCLEYAGTVTDPVTKRDVRKFRTSQATKAEFSAFVEWLAEYASKEYGVVVILPGEAA